MQIVNIGEAKTRLSDLVESAIRGEAVVIARAGKPVASLVAIESVVPIRRAGALKGKIKMTDDFDTVELNMAGMINPQL